MKLENLLDLLGKGLQHHWSHVPNPGAIVTRFTHVSYWAKSTTTVMLFECKDVKDLYILINNRFHNQTIISVGMPNFYQTYKIGKYVRVFLNEWMVF